MEIRETEFGLANNYGSHIEINKHLRSEYPALYNKLIEHELAHSNAEGFSKYDFMLDISDDSTSNWKTFKFMIHHPKTFFQLLPFYRKQGVWFYDLNLIIFYSIFIGVLGLSVYLSV